MLTLNDISHHIGGRLLFDQASAQIGDRQKVGLVGRNGAGKSTLLRLISGEMALDNGTIELANRRRIGSVAQEVPAGPTPLVDVVLEADTERTSLLAEAETATDPNRIAEIHTRLADIEAHSAPARASAILAGLGFSEADQTRPVSDFSGGWRMRVALAAALFAKPDFLLLDEPTNHLDLEAALWLETYLASYPFGLILVSHDREILNKIPDFILHLDQGKLTRYAGGYDRFERTRNEQQARQSALYSRQQEQRRHIQAFVDRFKAKASKAKQAQSRLKMLERMEPIAAINEDRSISLTLPKPEPLSPPVLVIEEGAVGYQPETPILTKLEVRIDMDDRIALLGANGNGKTTLLRLLAGRLKLGDGRMRSSSKLEVGYFAQSQLDELDGDLTALDHLKKLEPMTTEQNLRNHLGSFAFTQQKAEVKINNLSGGEKARLALAVICRRHPHILLLDEPTNHLDIDTRQVLIQALAEFEGAVILTSHDPHLVAATADRLWLVAEGTLSPFDGDLDQYKRHLFEQRRAEKQATRSDKRAGAPEQTQKRDDRKARAAVRAALAPLRSRIKKLETQIETETGKQERLHHKLSLPETYDGPPAELTKLQRQAADVASTLETLELEWLEASEELEKAQESA